jgi:hypothetical protein
MSFTSPNFQSQPIQQEDVPAVRFAIQELGISDSDSMLKIGTWGWGGAWLLFLLLFGSKVAPAFLGAMIPFALFLFLLRDAKRRRDLQETDQSKNIKWVWEGILPNKESESGRHGTSYYVHLEGEKLPIHIDYYTRAMPGDRVRVELLPLSQIIFRLEKIEEESTNGAS